MAVPSTIKIGPMLYDVQNVSELRGKDADGNEVSLNGDIEYHTHTIRLEADLKPEMQTYTALHESIHGVLYQAGHTDHDEQMVIALTYGLVSLFKDNPELISLLREL